MRPRQLFCFIHNEEKFAVGKRPSYRCRSCFNEYRKKYNLENKDKVKEKNRKYNALTRSRRQEWTKQDRLNNPDRYKLYAKKYYANDEASFNAKRLARKYGLTFDEYIQMINDCSNKCHICKKEETRKSGKSERYTRLSIDHCHNTNKVRGLLCFDCNIMLGKAKDSIEILQKAINYLKESKS